MPATIVSRTPTWFTLQVEVPYSDSMLGFEETLLDRLNQAGVEATAEGLRQFDTDGSPIALGPDRLTSRGLVEKDYQTPYDRDARIVVSSTPRFAKVVAPKYAEFSSTRVREDLGEDHGRAVSRCLVRDVAEAAAAVAQVKQESWSYSLPRFERPPASVGIGPDGTCLLMGEDGWRETMLGTLAFHDAEGERQHTVYPAAAPSMARRSSWAGWRRRSTGPSSSSPKPAMTAKQYPLQGASFC
jgi:hypothetical protein